MQSSSILSEFQQQLPMVYQAMQQGQFAQVDAWLQQWPLQQHLNWLMLSIDTANGLNKPQLSTLLTQAINLFPLEPAVLLQCAQVYLGLRQRAQARTLAQSAAQLAPADASYLRAVATLFNQLDDPAQALPLLLKAVQLQPEDAALRFDLALAQFFLGKMDEAAASLNLVLAKLPTNANALHLRSALKTATQQHNHLADLQQRLQRADMSQTNAVGAQFALAKEAEDLGQYPLAFAALKQGAALKRKSLNYDAKAEFATFAALKQAYSQQFCQQSLAAAPTTEAVTPIFIVGMPRTGTTLVERILSKHPSVVSIGEFPDLPVEIAAAAQQRWAELGQQGSLVDASLQLDFAQLGQRYLHLARQLSGDKAYFIDKLPFNFMYCGLIQKALPQAKIIHLVRDPLDTCFAVFKTLFHQVYSFSYQLDELADYYIEYKAMMAHWHQVMPGQILDVHYEQLVAEPETQAQRLLNWCGLEWQADVLDFHANTAASTTASAAQVRQPVHQKSVQKWRHFADELAPVRAKLLAAGVIDADGWPV